MPMCDKKQDLGSLLVVFVRDHNEHQQPIPRALGRDQRPSVRSVGRRPTVGVGSEQLGEPIVPVFYHGRSSCFTRNSLTLKRSNLTFFWAQ